MGFRVQGLGFRVWGGLEFRGLGGWGLGCRVWGLWGGWLSFLGSLLGSLI